MGLGAGDGAARRRGRMNTRTLILHRRYDEDSQLLWRAATAAGMRVVRFNYQNIMADDESLYASSYAVCFSRHLRNDSLTCRTSGKLNSATGCAPDNDVPITSVVHVAPSGQTPAATSAFASSAHALSRLVLDFTSSTIETLACSVANVFCGLGP